MIKRIQDLRFPFVGLALGAGLLIAESILLVAGFMSSFGAGGIWREMGAILLGYMAVGAVLDLLVQLLAPARWKGSVVLRGAPLLAAAFLMHRTYGMASLLPYGTIPFAVLWAITTRVRWCWPLAGGLAFWALGPALPQAATAGERAAVGETARTQRASLPPAGSPSIVVVVLDTVRRDHCSTYGYARETTPNLSRLANHGVRFDRAYTTSCWSIPTHASLFTGLLPARHGADFEHFHLSSEVETLASLFAANGYETTGFTGNPYIASGTGFAHGFSRFEEAWRPAVLRRLLAADQMWARLWTREGDKGGAAVLAGARKWLAERDRARPYFLFVNFMEAHAPYQDVPLRFQREFTGPGVTASWVQKVGNASHEAQWLGTRVDERDLPGTFDLLDGATAAADHYLGELLETVGDAATVVVLSDHGDLVGEHGLFGHMTSLYEPLIHVPLVMAGPHLPEGVVTRELVSVADVLPTLAGLAGVEAPHDLDGVDVRPLLSGKAFGPQRVVHAEHLRTNVVTHLWTMNRTVDEMRSISARRAAAIGGFQKRIVAEDGTDAGYDLQADPAEEKPFAGSLTRLPAAVPKPAPRHGPGVHLDPAQIEALKSLGYVQ